MKSRMTRWCAPLLALALVGCSPSAVRPVAQQQSSAPAPSRTAPVIPLKAAPSRTAPTAQHPVPAGDRGRVSRVVDGDTLHVTVDGVRVKVRLLNVDAPETTWGKDDCLGDAATEAAAQLVPPGTTVVLVYDEERLDRYERTLAGVYLLDGRLLNAELARRGLAWPVTYQPNVRFRPAVDAAWEEARARGAGLFAPGLTCDLSLTVKAEH